MVARSARSSRGQEGVNLSEIVFSDLALVVFVIVGLAATGFSILVDVRSLIIPPETNGAHLTRAPR